MHRRLQDYFSRILTLNVPHDLILEIVSRIMNHVVSQNGDSEKRVDF